MENKINILFIHHVSFMGGAERHLLSLIESLNDKYVVFFICQEQGALTECLKRNNVTVEYMSLKAWRKPINFIHQVYTIRNIVNFCRRNKINLICSNNYRVSPFAVIPSKKLGIPSITILQDFVERSKLRKFKALDSDFIITVSDSVTESISTFYKNLIFRIYNGLNFNAFDNNNETGSSIIKEFPQLINKRIVGMVAQIVPIKGHKLFFRAMKKVSEQFNDVLFLVVGESPDNKQLSRQDLIDDLKDIGMESKFLFLGERSDISNILKHFDILVLASKREPFGRVIIEAMGMGVPVVATRCGGPSEIIIDEENGILVPVDEENKMAAAVIALLKNESKRRTFGIRAREHVFRNFDLKNTVFRINEVFSKILGI